MQLNATAWKKTSICEATKKLTLTAESDEEAEDLAKMFKAIRQGRIRIVPEQPSTEPSS